MRTGIIGVACLTVALDATAQPQTFRVQGSVKTDAGAPVEGAKVRALAITGFQGGPTTGATAFTATTNKKGDWSILGLTTGTWIFDARADGLLPQVIVLPVMLAERQLPGQYQPMLSFSVPFTLHAATGPGEALARVAKDAAPDTAQATIAGLTDAANSTDAAVLIAAGDIALLAQQPRNARILYEKAAQRQPADPLATIGLASAALMMRDYDAALKHFWSARETVPKPLQPACGAAIKDLQKIALLK